MKLPPRLRKGELVRLTPDGPIHTVIRVTIGNAYVKAGDWTTDVPGGVLPGLETGVDMISLHSFVYRVRKEDHRGEGEAAPMPELRRTNATAGDAGEGGMGKM